MLTSLQAKMLNAQNIAFTSILFNLSPAHKRSEGVVTMQYCTIHVQRAELTAQLMHRAFSPCGTQATAISSIHLCFSAFSHRGSLQGKIEIRQSCGMYLPAGSLSAPLPFESSEDKGEIRIPQFSPLRLPRDTVIAELAQGGHWQPLWKRRY